MNCERCHSSMQYTTTEEVYKDGVCDTDYWLCLFCGNETITIEQIRINDARTIAAFRRTERDSDHSESRC